MFHLLVGSAAGVVSDAARKAAPGEVDFDATLLELVVLVAAEALSSVVEELLLVGVGSSARLLELNELATVSPVSLLGGTTGSSDDVAVVTVLFVTSCATTVAAGRIFPVINSTYMKA